MTRVLRKLAFAPSLALLTLAGCSSKPAIEVRQPAKDTEVVAPTTNDRDTQFLVEMAEGRLMDTQEGQMAADHGHTQRVRTYGHKMVKDQIHIMTLLQDVAQEQKIPLPDHISDQKADALNDLRLNKGIAFDKHFITMMKKDYQRDVKAFQQAADPINGFSPQVQEFAKKMLPAIEGHLERIIEMDKTI